MKESLKKIFVMFFIFLGSIVYVGCDYVSDSTNNNQNNMKMEDYNKVSCRVGYSSGALTGKTVEEYFSKAKTSSYLFDIAAYLDIVVGKMDAYIVEETIGAEALRNYNKNMFVLHRFRDPIDIAFGVSRSTKIPNLKEKLNEFIKYYNNTGSIQDMLNKWLSEPDVSDYDNLIPENPEFTIRVGTVGTVPPLNFYRHQKLTGFDIEIIEKFAKYVNAKVEYVLDTFPGCIKNLKDGKVDVVSASLTITESRKRIIDYSDPIYTTNVIMLARREKPFDKEKTVCYPQKLLFNNVVFTDEKIAGIIKTDNALKINNIIMAKSELEAVEAVNKGDVDAFITSFDIAEKFEKASYYFTNLPFVCKNDFKLGVLVKSRDFYDF